MTTLFSIGTNNILVVVVIVFFFSAVPFTLSFSPTVVGTDLPPRSRAETLY